MIEIETLKRIGYKLLVNVLQILYYFLIVFI